MKLVVAYIATGLAFALIDSVWLINMAPRLYKPEIGEMMAEPFRLKPAIVFYLLYIGGMMWFAVVPGQESLVAFYAASIAHHLLPDADAAMQEYPGEAATPET